jgi:hypothetical protein
MDGGGALIWITNVFRALKGIPLDQAASQTNDAEFVTSLPHHHRNIATVPRHKLMPIDTERALGWHLDETPGIYPGILSRVGLAIAEVLKIDEPTFIIPTNIRRHNRAVKSTANLVPPISITLPKYAGWEAMQLKVIEALKNKRELNIAAVKIPVLTYAPLPLLAGVFWLLKPIQRLWRRYLYHVCLSHLGKVKLSDLSSPSFHATSFLSLPMPHTFGPLMAQILEVDDRTIVLLGAQDGVLTPEQAQAIHKHCLTD